MNSSLAERMRPSAISDMVGQSHLLSEKSPLNKILNSGFLPNMIFYGPPGTGKTTLAVIIAKMQNKTFRRVNATVVAGKEIKDILRESDAVFTQEGVVLYIDEIQYLNKKQQQTLLEYIEDGRVTLIASTTENPYLYIYKAILSRSSVFEFKPLEKEDVEKALFRAADFLNAENSSHKILLDEASQYIAELCGGDMRGALNALELAYYIADEEINLECAKGAITKNPLSFDKDGDIHYELLSAFQKSIRGSDENAAIFYLARLLEGGDILSPCRRLQVIAAEDVGLAYPQAISIVRSCVEAAKDLGLPEARLPLAEATILLATAPKSNSAYMAFEAASEDVRSGKGKNIPNHIKNMHYYGEGEKKSGYKYPHNYPNSWVKQQYLPDDIKDKKYYRYGENKTELAAKEHNEKKKV